MTDHPLGISARSTGIGRRMSRWGLVIAAAALIAGPARAAGSYMSGSMILEVCEAELEGDACVGYVIGVLDAFDLAFGSTLFCAPPELDSLQAARVVVKFLKEHPADLHHDAPSLIYNAMLHGYPCSGET